MSAGAAAAHAAADDLVPAVLEEYGRRVGVVLAEYLARREPRRHLYDLVADYPQRGGRMLRPSLCLAAARAFGAPLEDAVRTAVALELFHNAFLVHDDVQDESDERRGRPTMHVLHGVPVAVNVGDTLLLLGMRALMDNRRRLGPRLTMRILEETERMGRESVEGQAIELGWRRDNPRVLPDGDYLHMVLKKTCWYTSIYPMLVGALIGMHGAPPERCVRFGFFLGAAFQIQDDLLNLVGDPRRYGKELGGDILEGKRTLILIDLLRKADDHECARLLEFLALPRSARTPRDVDWIRRSMEERGCIEHARRSAHGLAGAAHHEWRLLARALPDGQDKRFLEALPSWVLSRA